MEKALKTTVELIGGGFEKSGEELVVSRLKLDIRSVSRLRNRIKKKCKVLEKDLITHLNKHKMHTQG